MERGLEHPTSPTIECPDCSHHFQIDPRGDIQEACPDCGSNRMWFNQPSPTQSDGTLRDMVDSDSQKDQGGNPLAEGTIMGGEGEKPLDRRDNYMHGHVLSAFVAQGELYPPAQHTACPHCGGALTTFSDSGSICDDCGTVTPPEYKDPYPAIHMDEHAETWRTPSTLKLPTKDQSLWNRVWEGPRTGATPQDDPDPQLKKRESMKDFERHSRSMEPYESLWEHIAQEEQPAQPDEQQQAPTAPVGGLGGGTPVPGVGGLMQGVMGGGEAAGGAAGGAEAAAGLGGLAELAPLALLAAAEKEAFSPEEQLAIQQGPQMNAEEMFDSQKSKAQRGEAVPGWERRVNPREEQAPMICPACKSGQVIGPACNQCGTTVEEVLSQPTHHDADQAFHEKAEREEREARNPLLRGNPEPFDEETGEIYEPGYPRQAEVLDAFLSHYETPASNPDVGTKHDDPEKVDQKEFNDQDHSPKNIKNPETGEPGGATSGEPGHEKQDMDNFADDSPAVETLTQLLPLLLHFFNSGESGANHPAIKGLHEMLESEHPGYLDKGDPHHAEILIQTLQPKHAVIENAGVTGETPEMIGQPQQQVAPAPVMPNATQPPGGDIQGGHCPSCGSPLDPGTGGCPMCGQKSLMNQTAPQTTMPGSAFQQAQQQLARAANHQGPTTPEQIAVVQQWLIEHGRQGEVPNVPLDPGNPEYVKILSDIQGRANVAPQVSPQEATPPPPPAPPGGSMPVPGMGGGAPEGAPMQPMASKTASGQCPNCEGPSTLLGQLGNRIHYRCRHCGLDHSSVYKPKSSGEFQDFEEELGHHLLPYEGSIDEDSALFYSHVIAADNVADRCPECGSGTTGMVGDDKNTQHCHACGYKWAKDDVVNDNAIGTSTFARVAAPVVNNPNPVDAPAAEQASPLDIQPNEDSGLTWKDESGEPLQAGQTYMMKSAQYPVPDMVKIMRVKPDGLEVNEIGTFGNESNSLHHTIHITREEMQTHELTFAPAPQDADDRNAEPPQGGQAPGLPPQQETTDERTNAYPAFNSSVREDVCAKCGHADGDVTNKGHRIGHTSTMISEDSSEYECGKCGNHWIAKEEVAEGDPRLADARAWIKDDDDDDFSERMRAMASARSSQSRSISDIPRDKHAQEVSEYLDEQKKLTKEGGRYFSPLEQRTLIDEDGVARNSDLLNLEGTHYKSSTEENKLDPDRVPFEHILFGI